MDGFNVDIHALNEYSRTLAQHRSAVTKTSGLVDQADVSNESWGVVGLFVKQEYSDMLSDLKDLMSEMEAGIQTASEKIGRAAERYQENEDETQRILQKTATDLEKATVKEVHV